MKKRNNSGKFEFSKMARKIDRIIGEFLTGNFKSKKANLENKEM